MHRTRNGVLLTLALLMAATEPSSCSKLFRPIGDSGSGTSGALDGYYEGSFSDFTTGASGTVAALITEDGHAKIAETFSDGSVAILDAPDLTLDNGRVDSAYTRYTSVALLPTTGATHSATTTGTLQGNLAGNQILNLEFTATSPSPGDNGTLALSYQAQQYQQRASLALVAGTYASSYTDSRGVPVTATVTLDSDGHFGGRDTDGCQYSGQLSVPDDNRNLYAGQWSFTCPRNVTASYDLLGTYTATTATTGGGATLLLLATDTTAQLLNAQSPATPPAAQQFTLQR